MTSQDRYRVQTESGNVLCSAPTLQAAMEAAIDTGKPSHYLIVDTSGEAAYPYTTIREIIGSAWEGTPHKDYQTALSLVERDVQKGKGK